MKRPALFLDRDGTIHKEKFYLSRKEEVEWTDGIFDLCRRAQESGFVIVVVTNQSGIARGKYSEADFHSLMAWMDEQFRGRGVRWEKYYFCPHLPDASDPRYARECANRKPSPGMLLRAARELDLDLGSSILVGDRCGDVGAANAAGLARAYLLAGTEAADCAGKYTQINHLSEVEFPMSGFPR